MSSWKTKEGEMFRSRVFACVALITLAFLLFTVADALAGWYKGRTVFYNTKWEQIEVGDEEGHVVAVGEGKGIFTGVQGDMKGDGAIERTSGYYDINFKTGVGTAWGYSEITYPDGDKSYARWEGRMVGKGLAEGTFIILKGTGKLEGIQGKGTWVSHRLTPTQRYSDVEGEIVWPTR